MKIALFTNGQKSIIGNDRGVVSAFNPLLLFQNPELFGPRFFHQAKSRLGIDDFSEVEQLIIGLTGRVDQEKNTIFESYLLNDLSRTKIYNGFNFNESLRDIISKDKILMVNDAFIVGLGVQQIVKTTELPCMVLAIDKGVGVCFISEANNILAAEWGGDLIKSIRKSIYELLTTDNIYNILYKNAIDFNTEYTRGLVHAIKHLEHKYAINNSVIKSVVILGEKTEYMNVEYLKDNHKHLDITVITDSNKANEIIMNGSFAYSDYVKSRSNQITKIHYFSGEKMIRDFANFEKCISHFKSAKPLNNLLYTGLAEALNLRDNHYKIFRVDGSVEMISMKDIKDVAELEKYRF